MIYNYEAEVLRFFHKMLPEVREMTYSSEEDLFNALDRIKKYPNFYYYREKTEWLWDKPIIVAPAVCLPAEITMYPFTQKYVGKIFVENQKNAFDLVKKIKFGWSKLSASVPVSIPEFPKTINPDTGNEEYERIGVQLRLTGISVEDVRLPNNTLGACRAVTISWQSNLFLIDRNPAEGDSKLVEEVRISYEIKSDNIVVGHPIESDQSDKQLIWVPGSNGYIIKCEEHTN